jgi:ATP-dependent Clp protease ATP-binding subunit ClpC
LLDRAVAGLDERQAADAVLVLRPGSEHAASEAFAADLVEMYATWARKRGMRFDSVRLDGAPTMVFSGLGAYTILAPEAGLHTLEVPTGERGYERISVLVQVAPLSAGRPEAPLEERAREALAGQKKPRRVVRRYRREPSPLVRDSVRGWRTGRVGLVLAGDFDVIV